MGSKQHIQNNDLVYDAALLFWRAVTNIFFREIRPRGAFNIPREGPVIFVAAPHNNQVRSGYTSAQDQAHPALSSLILFSYTGRYIERREGMYNLSLLPRVWRGDLLGSSPA